MIIFNGIRVYTAAPYTKGEFGTDGNLHVAMKAWHELTDLGYVAYCPHINFLLGTLRPRVYQEWLDHDKEWMHLCHVMVRLPGESRGADAEEREFQGPIFRSIEELETWKQGMTEKELADFVSPPAVDMQNDVAEFHHLMGAEDPEVPAQMDEETTALRISLVREETAELIAALAGGDLATIGQEAVDLVYVVIGTLVSAGLDMAPIWSMVHEANMAKEPDPRAGKARKPDGWTPPDVASEVVRQIG